MNEDTAERILVERAAAGDRAAFAALHAAHREGLRRFLFHLAVRPDDLDDAEQEVFLVTLRGLDTFAARSTFRTWIYGIAVNVARTIVRRARPQSEIEDMAIDSDPASVEEGRELAARLTRAIARLPEPQKEAFVLHHVEDWSFPEVSAALGVPEGTLRRRVFEARDSLRVWLEKREVTR